MLSRYDHNERARSRAYKLSREIQHFYANHMMAPWQHSRIGEIRALYEAAQKKLAKAHDLGSSRISEEFMQLELDTLFAMEQFRENNPGQEWHPDGIRGFFYKAFWKNIYKRMSDYAQAVGAPVTYGEKEIAK